MKGHNPAKSYLDSGADIVLENGLRLEVKSSYKHKRPKEEVYTFTLKGGRRYKTQDLTGCDFFIFWCIDDNCFFIVPRAMVIQKCIVGLSSISENSRGKYIKYKNKWELLEVK